MGDDAKVLHTFEAGLRIDRILWAAFMASTVMFGVVLVILLPEPTSDSSTIPFVLFVMATMQVPFLLFVRYWKIGGLGLRAPDDLRTVDTAPVTPLQAEFAVIRYRTATLISSAFAESIVLFGFVSSWTSGNLLWFGLHAVVGMGLMLLIVPRAAGYLVQFEPAERSTLRRLMSW